MPVLPWRIMTRQQVAQRLGKSVATVRRIEGVLLHPTVDSRGTHRFDDDEVEALAHDIQSGKVTVWQELQRGSSDPTGSVVDLAKPQVCVDCIDLSREVEQLRDELKAQRTRHQRERQQLEAERHEFEVQLVELMTAVESLTG